MGFALMAAIWGFFTRLLRRCRSIDFMMPKDSGCWKFLPWISMSEVNDFIVNFLSMVFSSYFRSSILIKVCFISNQKNASTNRGRYGILAKFLRFITDEGCVPRIDMRFNVIPQ